MFCLFIIALGMTVAQDRDLLAVVAYDGISHEDHAPDNVVLLLELWALEDSGGTSTFKERFGYISDHLERVI